MKRSHASIHSLRIAGYLASHLSSIASRAAAAAAALGAALFFRDQQADTAYLGDGGQLIYSEYKKFNIGWYFDGLYLPDGAHETQNGYESTVSVTTVEVTSIEQADGIKIPYRIAERRAGDIATCYAGTEKAARMLNWRAEKTLQDMCRDGWRWQQNCGK